MKCDTYKTRDGREARIYATDGGGAFPVHGAISINEQWSPGAWTARGIRLDDTGGSDLIDYPRKTWKLPDPPEGQKWHRDDWTAEMLPEGYRPLLEHEHVQSEDEIDSESNAHTKWTVHIGKEWINRASHISNKHWFFRTTRSLPTPKPKRVPLTPEDVPPGSAVRHYDSDKWHMVTRVCPKGLIFESGFREFVSAKEQLEIKRPGEDWKPCWKEVQP